MRRGAAREVERPVPCRPLCWGVRGSGSRWAWAPWRARSQSTCAPFERARGKRRWRVRPARRVAADATSARPASRAWWRGTLTSRGRTRDRKTPSLHAQTPSPAPDQSLEGPHRLSSGAGRGAERRRRCRRLRCRRPRQQLERRHHFRAACQNARSCSAQAPEAAMQSSLVDFRNRRRRLRCGGRVGRLPLRRR